MKKQLRIQTWIQHIKNPWVKFTYRFILVGVWASVLGKVITAIGNALLEFLGIPGNVGDLAIIYSVAFVVAYLGFLMIQRFEEVKKAQNKRFDKLSEQILKKSCRSGKRRKKIIKR